MHHRAIRQSAMLTFSLVTSEAQLLCKHTWRIQSVQDVPSKAGHSLSSATGGECASESQNALPRNSIAIVTPTRLHNRSFLIWKPLFDHLDLGRQLSSFLAIVGSTLHDCTS